MKSYLSLLIIGISLILSSCSSTNQMKWGKWQTLFNGKDFTGWDIKTNKHPLNDNYGNIWRVEDGIIKVDYSEMDTFQNEFSHLYYEKPYSHYHLKLQYRIVGEALPGTPSYAVANSGVMLHSQSAADQQLNQGFPASIEMQFLGAVDGENRTIGNLASPGTHVTYMGAQYEAHMLYSDTPAPPVGEQWVDAEAIVLGDSIVHHIINGDTVLSYTNPIIGGWEQPDQTFWVEDKTWVNANAYKPLQSGYIALQAEGHPIHFRNIKIRELK